MNTSAPLMKIRTKIIFFKLNTQSKKWCLEKYWRHFNYKLECHLVNLLQANFVCPVKSAFWLIWCSVARCRWLSGIGATIKGWSYEENCYFNFKVTIYFCLDSTLACLIQNKCLCFPDLGDWRSFTSFKIDIPGRFFLPSERSSQDPSCK